MSSFYLILALVFSLLIAIVALANNDTVTVSYLFGRSEISLILLILGSAFGGALVMGLFSLFRFIRSALAFREIRHQKEDLQNKLKSLEEERLFLEAKLNRCSSDTDEQEEEEEVAKETVAEESADASAPSAPEMVFDPSSEEPLVGEEEGEEQY